MTLGDGVCMVVRHHNADSEIPIVLHMAFPLSFLKYAYREPCPGIQPHIIVNKTERMQNRT